ncbi:hypothetical protein [Bradyrhizobium sp. USDA 4451]
MALTIMGVWVSIRPPASGTRAQWIWVAAFLIIGFSTAAALFWELRGTDATLDKIAGHLELESGPRLEFAGIKYDEKSEIASIQFSNTRDIDAVSVFISGGIVVTENDLLDIQTALTAERSDAIKNSTLHKGATPVSRGMGITLSNLRISKEDVAAISNGTKRGYLLALAIYVGGNTPAQKLWATKICAVITKPMDTFEPCPGIPTGYFYSDKELTEVPKP